MQQHDQRAATDQGIGDPMTLVRAIVARQTLNIHTASFRLRIGTAPQAHTLAVAQQAVRGASDGVRTSVGVAHSIALVPILDRSRLRAYTGGHLSASIRASAPCDRP